MKKTTLLITFLLVCLSCKKGIKKSDFIGNWSTTSDTNAQIDISFFKDSMVIDNSLMNGSYSNKWKIKGSKIKQTLLRGDTTVLSNENAINFKFNLTKDTLLLKSKNDSILYIKLRKINNAYEYFENKIGLKIELKKRKKRIIPIKNNEFNFNIYITKEKDKLITKTDYSKNLNNLIQQTLQFETQFTHNEMEQLRYVLFIDKRVSKKQVDSIKSILLTYPINKVFEVYNYKESNWNEELSWLGEFDN
ncbi:hypothetical protein [uncultured Tenacibaculum sp.]|uniref:hypothetical protein n=1 Tax=uncultured Tenacibaculum sp. TaxID=174713 RepID=UPI00260E26E4|nr:hypothetical protein [uncultured Tenacibaculum sp.]